MFSFRKAFEKQTKKHVCAIKSLDLSNKKDDLKQIEVVFSQNLMNDLIHDKLKKIEQIIYVVNQKVEKFIILVNIIRQLFF